MTKIFHITNVINVNTCIGCKELHLRQITDASQTDRQHSRNHFLEDPSKCIYPQKTQHQFVLPTT